MQLLFSINLIFIFHSQMAELHDDEYPECGYCRSTPCGCPTIICPDCGLIEDACACEEEQAKEFVSFDDQLSRQKARRDAKFQEDRKLHEIARLRALQSRLDSTRKQQVEQDKRIVRGGGQNEVSRASPRPHHRAKRFIQRSKHVSDVLMY